MEHIIAGSGELHLRMCMAEFEDTMPKIDIIQSEPIVSYKETVIEESDRVCLAKSSNKHNRLFGKARPLEEEIIKLIEDGDLQNLKSQTSEKQKEIKDTLKEFSWTKDDIKRIWQFGPDEEPSSVLVNSTKQVQYLKETRDSIVKTFEDVTISGVLCNETLRGVRFDILDAKFHADNVHRGPGSVMPMARRMFYSC